MDEWMNGGWLSYKNKFMSNNFSSKLEIINKRKNINRGYRKLIVWQDSLQLYSLVYKTFHQKKEIPFKTSADIIDAAHSVPRNIAEGYGRRSKIEYVRFLNFAVGSCAETHSGICACFVADQISETEFEEIDLLHYKVENALINLVISIQKLLPVGWENSFMNLKAKLDQVKISEKDNSI
jgi:four helix bundle protein